MIASNRKWLIACFCLLVSQMPFRRETPNVRQRKRQDAFSTRPKHLTVHSNKQYTATNSTKRRTLLHFSGTRIHYPCHESPPYHSGFDGFIEWYHLSDLRINDPPARTYLSLGSSSIFSRECKGLNIAATPSWRTTRCLNKIPTTSRRHHHKMESHRPPTTKKHP